MKNAHYVKSYYNHFSLKILHYYKEDFYLILCGFKNTPYYFIITFLFNLNFKKLPQLRSFQILNPQKVGLETSASTPNYLLLTSESYS